MYLENIVECHDVDFIIEEYINNKLQNLNLSDIFEFNDFLFNYFEFVEEFTSLNIQHFDIDSYLIHNHNTNLITRYASLLEEEFFFNNYKELKEKLINFIYTNIHDIDEIEEIEYIFIIIENIGFKKNTMLHMNDNLELNSFCKHKKEFLGHKYFEDIYFLKEYKEFIQNLEFIDIDECMYFIKQNNIIFNEIVEYSEFELCESFNALFINNYKHVFNISEEFAQLLNVYFLDHVEELLINHIVNVLEENEHDIHNYFWNFYNLYYEHIQHEEYHNIENKIKITIEHIMKEFGDIFKLLELIELHQNSNELFLFFVNIYNDDIECANYIVNHVLFNHQHILQKMHKLLTNHCEENNYFFHKLNELFNIINNKECADILNYYEIEHNIYDIEELNIHYPIKLQKIQNNIIIDKSQDFYFCDYINCSEILYISQCNEHVLIANNIIIMLLLYIEEKKEKKEIINLLQITERTCEDILKELYMHEIINKENKLMHIVQQKECMQIENSNIFFKENNVENEMNEYNILQCEIIEHMKSNKECDYNELEEITDNNDKTKLIINKLIEKEYIKRLDFDVFEYIS